MAGKDEEKQHKRRWRKSRTGSGEDSSETELRRSSKSLSVTREKYRRSKASQADIALKVPDFEDYKDLMNDDTAGGPELGKLCVLVRLLLALQGCAQLLHNLLCCRGARGSELPQAHKVRFARSDQVGKGVCTGCACQSTGPFPCCWPNSSEQGKIHDPIQAEDKRCWWVVLVAVEDKQTSRTFAYAHIVPIPCAD